MLKYKGVKMPEWFMVNGTVLDGLPMLSASLSQINGGIGNTFHQQKVGSRTITIDYTIKGKSVKDLRVKTKQITKMLYSEEPDTLELTNDPEVYYYAILTNTINQTEMFNIAKGTLTFLVPDGMARSKTTQTVALGDNAQNNGIFPTLPRVILQVEEPTPSITLIGNTGVLALGNSDVSEQPAHNPRKRVFHDQMSSITGWANGSNFEGINAGTIKSNGYSISVDDFGSGNGWHGPVKVKSFEASQDFGMYASLANLAGKKGELGRIHIQLQDANGVNVAMIELRNADPNRIKPMVRAMVGSRKVAETFGHSPGVWAKWNSGELHISRKGTKITFFAGLKKPDGTLHTRWSYTFNDVKKEFQRKVSRIQISMQAFHEAPPSWLNIADLKVEKHEASAQVNSSNELIFQEGDILVIDSDTTEISLNGEPAYHLLDPSSTYPVIEVGANQIVVSEDVVNGTIQYTELF